MSLESVKQIVGHAMLDAEFRKKLFENPAEALKGYELTEQELALLKDLPQENFESAAGELSERISRAGIIFKPETKPFPGPSPHDLK